MDGHKEIKEIAWCSEEAVVVFSRDTASMTIVTVDGDTEAFYFADFVSFVQELDGVRVFSLSGQEFVQQVGMVGLPVLQVRFRTVNSQFEGAVGRRAIWIPAGKRSKIAFNY